MANVEFDTSEFREFFRRVRKAARGDFKKELEQYLEALGFEFLRIVQDEIMRRKVMDTRLLLHSFHKDDVNNIWVCDNEDFTIEIGTNVFYVDNVGSEVHYASYVNDGHWTNPKGVAVRFVPGYWEGERFIYDPKADGGMALKQKWVPGSHFWESALHAMDKMLPGLLDRKLQEWFDNYFS